MLPGAFACQDKVGGGGIIWVRRQIKGDVVNNWAFVKRSLQELDLPWFDE